MRRSRRRDTGGSPSNPLSTNDNDDAVERRTHADCLRQQRSNPGNAVRLFQEPPSLTIGRLVTEADPESRIGQRRNLESQETGAEAATPPSSPLMLRSERWTSRRLLGGGDGSSFISTKNKTEPNNNRNRSSSSPAIEKVRQLSSGTFVNTSAIMAKCISLELPPGEVVDKQPQRKAKATAGCPPDGRVAIMAAEEASLSGSGTTRVGEEDFDGGSDVRRFDLDCEDGSEHTKYGGDDSDDDEGGGHQRRRGKHQEAEGSSGAPEGCAVKIHRPPARGRTQSLHDAHSLYRSTNWAHSKSLVSGLSGKRRIGSAALAGCEDGGNQSVEGRNGSSSGSINPKTAIHISGAGAPPRNKRGLMTAQLVVQAHADRIGYMRSMGYGAKPMRSLHDRLNNSERAALAQGLHSASFCALFFCYICPPACLPALVLAVMIPSRITSLVFFTSGK